MDADDTDFRELIEDSARRAAAALGGARDPSGPEAEELRRRLVASAELLEQIAEDRRRLAVLSREERARLLAAVNRVAQPDRTERRRLSKALRRREAQERRRADEQRLDRTGIRRNVPDYARMTHAPSPELQRLPPPSLPEGDDPADTDWIEVEGARNCYVCKAEYRRVHPFYDQMCPGCATLNWRKRHQSFDLRGRRALLSGGRVKIGYQAGLKLLRAGAELIVTTRFPADAAARYAREEDFADFADRLQIHGLDLRHLPSVEAFTRFLVERGQALDFIVHNACQTVRRPVAWARHLMEVERRHAAALEAGGRALLRDHAAVRARSPSLPVPGDPDVPSLPGALAGWRRSAELSQVKLSAEDGLEGEHLFPEGAYDQDGQQIDLRARNSWRLRLHEVDTVELLEVQLVNSLAPFVMTRDLKPLLLQDGRRDRHVVNVSAMEGQFYRAVKTDKHPHTNMAKAALNMLTRTSAADYARDGIHMNSVDTGWITDEDPLPVAQRKRLETGFRPPLDVVDAAARILDPIFAGLQSGEHAWGKFFKDYRVTHW